MVSLLNYIVYYILPPILVAYFAVSYIRKRRGVKELSDKEARSREQLEEIGGVNV